LSSLSTVADLFTLTVEQQLWQLLNKLAWKKKTVGPIFCSCAQLQVFETTKPTEKGISTH